MSKHASRRKIGASQGAGHVFTAIVLSFGILVSCPNPAGGGKADTVDPGNSTNPGGSTNPGQASIDKFFWGSWVRMDGSNAEWYLSSDGASIDGSPSSAVTSPSSSGFGFGGAAVAKQTDNLLKVTPSGSGSLAYYLFRKSGATANASLGVNGNGTGSRALVSGLSSLAGIKVIIKNQKNSADIHEATSGQSGSIAYSELTAGDAYSVTVPVQAGVESEVKATVTPSFDGQDLGFVTVGKAAQNFKVSWDIGGSPGYLYAGRSYSLGLKIKNIGSADMLSADYLITAPSDMSLSGSLLQNILGTVPAGGGEKLITLSMTAAPFSEAQRTFDIPVKITAVDGTVWQDTVSLKIYREPMTIYVRSASAEVQGAIISPDRRSIPFATSGRAGSVTVPFLNLPYTLALSGAGYNSETKYSVSVGEAPPTDGGELTSATVNEQINDEAHTTALYAAQPTLGYLGFSDLDFYQVWSTTASGATAVTGIGLDPVSADISGAGTAALVATISPPTATDQRIAWTSDKPEVATVSPGGVVAGISAGYATITATAVDGGKAATCYVHVLDVAVSSVSLDKSAASIAAGGSLVLKATVSPSNAFGKTVAWSSDRSDVASVDSTGLVTALASGTATITASCGTQKAACSVSVNSPSALQWSQLSFGGDKAYQVWSAAAVSADGKTQIAAIKGGYIYVSRNGASWAECAGAGMHPWTAIAVSANGQVILASMEVVTYPSLAEGSLCLSKDGGSTWTTATASPKGLWSSVAVSADGTKMAAAMNTDGSSPGYVHTSSDGGATWTRRVSSGAQYWAGISGSDDMSVLYAGYIVYPSNISGEALVRVSTDFGATWSTATSVASGYGRDLRMDSSADGSILYLATGNQLFRYSGSPKAWALVASTSSVSHFYRSLACSADGAKVRAVSWGPESGMGSLVRVSATHASSDGGSTWTDSDTTATDLFPSCVAMSKDAASELIGSSWGYLRSSSDGGSSWTALASVGSYAFKQCYLSDDGKVIAAISYGGYVFLSKDSGTSWAPVLACGRQRWNSIAGSNDGSTLFLTSESSDTPAGYSLGFANGDLMVSRDTGSTWTTAVDPTNNYQPTTLTGVAVSGDGKRVYLGLSAYGDEVVHYSTDGGLSWLTYPNSKSKGIYNPRTYSCSDDGMSLVCNGGYSAAGGEILYPGSYVAVTGDGLYFVYDYYQMPMMSGPGYHYSVLKTSDSSTAIYDMNEDAGGSRIALSYDGRYVLTFSSAGNLIISDNYGKNWARRDQAGTRSWVDVAIRPDGASYLALDSEGVYAAAR